MKHPVKALTVASAIVWGACMLVIGLINMADPSYGGEFLRMMSSVYPGADTARTFSRVLLGTIYGFVDGALAGWLFALLFNLFGQDRTSHTGAAH
jgi:hypothetical protein